MYNNEYMYAIERNDEYLAHYGVRGMKWGVRKAIKSGNSKRLGRQYAKAQKKLAKLEKQATRSKKYARRAALMGAGAVAAGGLAAAGTAGVSRLTRKVGSVGAQAGRVTGGIMQKVGDAAYTYGRTPGHRTSKLGKMGTRYGKQLSTAGKNLASNAHGAAVAGRKAGTAITAWGKSTSLSTGAGNLLTKSARGSNKVIKGSGTALRNAGSAVRGSGVSNNTIARIGAGAVGAGLAVGAARNAYKAATAQKRAAKFKSEMNKAFAGTKYASGGNRQGKKRRRK